MVSSVSSSLSSWANTLFSRLDTSNKGYVSKTDLESAFSQISSSTSSTSSTSSSSDVADKLFSTLDSNGDSKITQDELATGLQKLADQLASQFSDGRTQSAVQGAQGNPPPPPPGNKDEGLTKDQLTAMASDVSSSNSTLASQLTATATNFDKADTNGDGKVSFQEFQAYNQSTQSTTATSSTASASTATSSGSSSTSTGSSQSGNLSDAELFKQIVALLQSYGAVDASAHKTATSTLSVSA